MKVTHHGKSVEFAHVLAHELRRLNFDAFASADPSTLLTMLRHMSDVWHRSGYEQLIKFAVMYRYSLPGVQPEDVEEALRILTVMGVQDE